MLIFRGTRDIRMISREKKQTSVKREKEFLFWRANGKHQDNARKSHLKGVPEKALS